MRKAVPFPKLAAAAVVLQWFVVGGSLHAQEASTGGRSDQKAPAPSVARVDADDEQALRENLGKKTIVCGLIQHAREWNGGASFLNFAGGKLLLVCFESEYVNFPGGRPAATMRDKRVEVTGYISEYRGKLQIKLTHPDQVRVINPAADAGNPPNVGGENEGNAKEPAPEASPAKVDPAKYFC